MRDRSEIIDAGLHAVLRRGGECLAIGLRIGAALLVTSSVAAANTTLPGSDRTVSQSLGVHIFSSVNDADLSGIGQLGGGWVRVQLDWRSIERGSPGNYEWDVVDPLVQRIRAQGLQPIFTLAYGNPDLYPIPGVPNTSVFGAPTADPTALAAFANWTRAVAQHFRDTPDFAGMTPIYEIWNEPDGETWLPGGTDAAQYTELVRQAANQINGLTWQPGQKPAILGPALSNLNASGRNFVQECIDAGILNYIDAVSVHPYRHTGDSFQLAPRIPETGGADYAALRTMMSNAGTMLPIVSSEWGYGSVPANGTLVEPRQFVTERQQAQYATRIALYNIMQDVPVSIWYDWKNSSETPADDETPTTWVENTGLVDHKYATNGITKESHTALTTLFDVLSDNVYGERLTTASDNDYVLRFIDESTGLDTLAVWTTGSNHTIQILDYVGETALLGTYQTRSMLGDSGTITAVAGALSVPVSRSPLYILNVPEPGQGAMLVVLAAKAGTRLARARIGKHNG